MTRILSVCVALLLAAPLGRGRAERVGEDRSRRDRGPTLGRAARLFARTQAVPRPRRAHRPSPTPRNRAPTTCSPSRPSKDAKWRNELPEFGKNWGGEIGPVTAPGWKDEVWGFTDADGNTRPNWTVYGTFSLGQKYDYDPDTKAFYFHAGGSTFHYDPKARTVDRPRAARPDRKARSAASCCGRRCATTATRRRSSSSAAATSRPSAATPAPGPIRPEPRPWEQVKPASNRRSGRTRGSSTTPSTRSCSSAATSSTSSCRHLGLRLRQEDLDRTQAEARHRRPAPGTRCSGCRRRRRCCCSAATPTPRPPTTSRRCTSRCRWKRGPTTSQDGEWELRRAVGEATRRRCPRTSSVSAAVDENDTVLVLDARITRGTARSTRRSPTRPHARSSA